jgi:hypothetical protein
VRVKDIEDITCAITWDLEYEGCLFVDIAIADLMPAHH